MFWPQFVPYFVGADMRNGRSRLGAGARGAGRGRYLGPTEPWPRTDLSAYPAPVSIYRSTHSRSTICSAPTMREPRILTDAALLGQPPAQQRRKNTIVIAQMEFPRNSHGLAGRLHR